MLCVYIFLLLVLLLSRERRETERRRYSLFSQARRKERGILPFFSCFSSFFNMQSRGETPRWDAKYPRKEDEEEEEEKEEREREEESKRKEKKMVVSLKNLIPSEISLRGRDHEFDQDCEEKDGEEKVSMLVHYWESSLSLFSEGEKRKEKKEKEEEERLAEVIQILTTWKEVCTKMREKGDVSLIHMKRLLLFLEDEENSSRRRRRSNGEVREEKSRYLYGGHSLPSQKREEKKETKIQVDDERDKTEDEEDVDALDLFDTFHALLQMRSHVTEYTEALRNDLYNEEEDSSIEEEEEKRRTRGGRGGGGEDERDETGVFSSNGLSDGHFHHINDFAALPLSIKKKAVLSAIQREEELESILQTGYCKQMKKVTFSLHEAKERSEEKEENQLLGQQDKQNSEEERGLLLPSEKTGSLRVLTTREREIGECEEEEERKDEEDHMREEKSGEKYASHDRKLRVLDVMRSVCIGSVENMISIQLHKLYKLATELRSLLKDFFFQQNSLSSLASSSNYRRLTQIQLYCEAQAQCRSFPDLHACKLQHSDTTGKSSKRGRPGKKDALSSFYISDQNKRKADEEDRVLNFEKEENGETEKSGELKKEVVNQEREVEEEGWAGKEKEWIIDREEKVLQNGEEGEEYLRDRRQRLLGQIALMEIAKSCKDILVFGGTFLRFLTSLGCMYTGGCDDEAGLSSDPSASDSTSQEGTNEDENKNRPHNRKPREKRRDLFSLDLSKDLQTKLSRHLEEIPSPDHGLQSALRLLSVLKKKNESR
ncbi:hypothetical protein CSUI_008271 [Cystoisospora suis]|uniref:Transmembrane protein n=1 Tax=Cystoisospora suis TaxID=483139 RepID=A0A2C6KN50_9APIC|nr:hypothetical protein CSUI_008271 [Cystoisospora suis]